MPEIDFITAQREVTAAGTPEKIKEAPEYTNSRIISVIIVTNHDNAGLIYLSRGDVRADAAAEGLKLPPNSTVKLDVSKFSDAYLDLSKFWIDAANAGDGISYVAFREIL